MKTTLELTAKQQAIQMQLFKDRTTNKYFTVDVYRPYITNGGEVAYYITDTTQAAFTEDALMTAIYTGSFKRGLTNIIAVKKSSK